MYVCGVAWQLCLPSPTQNKRNYNKRVGKDENSYNKKKTERRAKKKIKKNGTGKQ